MIISNYEHDEGFKKLIFYATGGLISSILNYISLKT